MAPGAATSDGKVRRKSRYSSDIDVHNANGPAVPSLRRLRTRRLDLEPVRTEHAEELAHALCDPSLHAYTGGRPLTPEEWRTRLTAWARGRSPDNAESWWNWVVRVRESGQVIGYVQATVTAAEATIAYVIGTPWQHVGYATEATRALIDHLEAARTSERLVAWIVPGHAASERVARAGGLSPTERYDEDGERAWSASLRGTAKFGDGKFEG